MIPKDKDLIEFAKLACKPYIHYRQDGSMFPWIGDLKEEDTIEVVLRRLIKQSEENGKEMKLQELRLFLGIED